MDSERSKWLMIIFAVLISLLFLRVIQLQIVERKKYSFLSQENAAKTVPILAPRGIIYDRQGKVLVENQPIFSVHVLPHIINAKKPEERDRIVKKLESIFKTKIDLKVNPYEPIIVRDNIPLETAVRLKEMEEDLAGVIVSSRPARLYPHNKLASHVLGYVGEIESSEFRKFPGCRLGALIGKDGVERTYDRYLRGVDGGKQVEVDVHGNPLRIVGSFDPLPGADLRLTIDLDLQKEIENYLKGYEGAVVVLDPRSGAILAMASRPTYDPKVFVRPLGKKEWKKLDRMDHPFMNRALSHYPPGSIYKPVTLTAALEKGLAKPDDFTTCRGYYWLRNHYSRCWLDGGHGRIDTMEGLVWSCDVVFYELGRKATVDLMGEYSRKYGLGQKTGIDLPQEKYGLIPTRDWKKKVYNDQWRDGDDINMGIGQGFVQVTPLQMAVMYGGLATGTMMKPYVVAEVVDRDGQILYQGVSKEAGPVPASEENLKLIQQALREVVKRATGVAAFVKGFPAAGKTGTAENPGKAHAWFCAYAPYNTPEVVAVAFIAHGEHGDRAPARLVGKIFRWYKANRLSYKIENDEAYGGQFIRQGERYVPYRNFLPKPGKPSTVEVMSE